MKHAWVTINGESPLEVSQYPSIQLNAVDTKSAISKVILIAKIRLRIKNKVN
jgi:hypothetical protein